MNKKKCSKMFQEGASGDYLSIDGHVPVEFRGENHLLVDLIGQQVGDADVPDLQRMFARIVATRQFVVSAEKINRK
jgi:hypothetical protein